MAKKVRELKPGREGKEDELFEFFLKPEKSEKTNAAKDHGLVEERLEVEE